MAIETKTVESDEMKMKYFSFGSGSKKLVIIPGLSIVSVMNFADSIAEAYNIFADAYQVFVFDRREDMPNPYTIHDMAEDTAKAMKELDIKDACLFGTSQGGMIVQAIAIHHPELVAKIALGSTVSRIGDLKEEVALGKWLELAKEKKAEELNMAVSEFIYSKETFEQFKAALISMGKMITDRDIERFIILAEGTGNMDLTEKLSSVRCPAFVVASEDDAVFDAGRMKETAKILGCESYFYKGFGHVVYDEAPDFKERLLRFFES